MLRKIELDGSTNVTAETIKANIAANVRLMLPQAQPHAVQSQRLAIVGGGPSLIATLDELRRQVFDQEVKVVALNGAYSYLIAERIRPSMMIMIDARAFNARFLGEPVKGCKYFLASQCHPETFRRALADDRDVTIFHCLSDDPDEETIVNDYYDRRWHAIPGGTTVMLRAIGLLRMLGFLKFDLYGFDSCWLKEDGTHPSEGDRIEHHAYQQPENRSDRAFPVWMIPKDPTHPTIDRKDLARQFWCDPWHMKQFEEWQAILKAYGHQFYAHVHGDGLIAYAMRTAASLSLEAPSIPGSPASERCVREGVEPCHS